jgi:hypothetical protein
MRAQRFHETRRRLPFPPIPDRDKRLRARDDGCGTGGDGMDRRNEVGEALSRIAPRIPRFEREAILDHAMDSQAMKRSTPENAAWLSLVSYVRHVLTDYDALIAEGYERESARFFVVDETNSYLEEWGATRRVETQE